MRTDPNLYRQIVWPVLRHNYPPPAAFAPAEPAPEAEETENRQIVGYVNGTVMAASSLLGNAIVDPTEEARFSAFWEAGSLAFTLQRPDGRSIDPGTSDPDVSVEAEEGAVVYTVSSPQPGTWGLRVEAVDVPSTGSACVVVVDVVSDLALDAEVEPASVAVGQPVTIRARYTLPEQVASSSVNATVSLPQASRQTFVLPPKGAEFEAAFDQTSETGFYGVEAKATGTLASGHAFSRISSDGAVFRAFIPTGRLNPPTNDYGYDANGDGKFEALVVEVPVEVLAQDQFTLHGMLVDSNGDFVAAAETESGPRDPGWFAAPLAFNSEDIYASGKPGPYTITGLTLFGGDDTLLDTLDPPYETQAYSLDQFTFTDSDGDGLSDATEERLHTDPREADSDGDGLSDYEELSRDGNPWVYTPGVDTDPNSWDTDGDGFGDRMELLIGSNPADSGSTPLPFVEDYLLGIGVLEHPEEADANRDALIGVADLVEMSKR